MRVFPRIGTVLPALCLIGALCAAPRAAYRVHNPPASTKRLLWEPPRTLTPSEWFWGSGGRSRAPVPPFRFVKEDLGGTSAKVKVRDARGVLWLVKFGGEVHSDTFTPRLVYAAGYFVEPTYFVRQGRIRGAHHLKRARDYIGENGEFRSARFKLHDEKTLPYADQYSWTWQENPFVGSHELNGLKIVMMLTSNWDSKDASDKTSNTSVFFRKADSAYLYLFTDWGSTMGKWGGYFHRSKWDSSGYAHETRKFIRDQRNGWIEWGYSGKHKRDLAGGITAEDVRWILPYLSRFTDDDLRAGLMASGATPAQAESFARSIRTRIRELEDASYIPEASSALGRWPVNAVGGFLLLPLRLFWNEPFQLQQGGNHAPMSGKQSDGRGELP